MHTSKKKKYKWTLVSINKCHQWVRVCCMKHSTLYVHCFVTRIVSLLFTFQSLAVRKCKLHTDRQCRSNLKQRAVHLNSVMIVLWANDGGVCVCVYRWPDCSTISPSLPFWMSAPVQWVWMWRIISTATAGRYEPITHHTELILYISDKHLHLCTIVQY